MNITVVSIDEKSLFNGCKVKCPNGLVKTIKVLPEGMTISEAVKAGEFNPAKNVDYETVMLNKTRFTLVNDED